uniref:Uncharacterized protein n=1 Tax=Fagus sylvatica TaxID=28930 RepID=A0A2N9EWI7_FAGSY
MKRVGMQGKILTITSVRMKKEKELYYIHVILGKELTVIMNTRRATGLWMILDVIGAIGTVIS